MFKKNGENHFPSMFGTTLGASRAATPDLANYQKIEEYSEIIQNLVLNII